MRQTKLERLLKTALVSLDHAVDGNTAKIRTLVLARASKYLTKTNPIVH